MSLKLWGLSRATAASPTPGKAFVAPRPGHSGYRLHWEFSSHHANWVWLGFLNTYCSASICVSCVGRAALSTGQQIPHIYVGLWLIPKLTVIAFDSFPGSYSSGQDMMGNPPPWVGPSSAFCLFPHGLMTSTRNFISLGCKLLEFLDPWLLISLDIGLKNTRKANRFAPLASWHTGLLSKYQKRKRLWHIHRSIISLYQKENSRERKWYSMFPQLKPGPELGPQALPQP